jgi:hypothetical protein
MVIRIAIVAGVLAGAAGAYAVAGGRSPASIAGAQAGKATITLRLTVGDTAPIVAKGVEGGPMRLALPDGTRLQFIPSLNEGALEVTIRDEEAADETKARVLRLDHADGAFDAEHGIQIDWLATDGPPIGESGLREPCTTCCVTCDGYTVCACEVTMSCGHCCCPSACTCSQ